MVTCAMKEEGNQAASVPFLQVKELTKRIGAQEILRGVDLQIATGKTLVIIGRSGGGKSVLLKHIIACCDRTVGTFGSRERASLDGRAAARADPAEVGILFQHGALFDSMSVEDNVAFRCGESGLRDVKAIADKVEEALEVVELGGQQKKMPVNLSGGMKKRVAPGAGGGEPPPVHPLRRADRRAGPGGQRQHQPAHPALAGAVRSHVAGGDARHEKRLRRGGPDRLFEAG